MNDYNTKEYQSQVAKITRKLAAKKTDNQRAIQWLIDHEDSKMATNIAHCGEHVGFTNVANVAKIIKADFCRERLCSVCAWRRQSRFLAQIFPVIEILEQQGYRFIMATLTIKNVPLNELKETIDKMLKGYDKLLKRRKIKRGWRGVCRSIELTYNDDRQDFHPHIHTLIAVDEDYFSDTEKYISWEELKGLWAEVLEIDYEPIVKIEVADNRATAAVETLKYALKPKQAEIAFYAFYYVLYHRRLISFSGAFAKIRKELKYSDFERVLTDAEDLPKTNKIIYQLYSWDASGGFYKFTQEYSIGQEEFLC